MATTSTFLLIIIYFVNDHLEQDLWLIYLAFILLTLHCLCVLCRGLDIYIGMEEFTEMLKVSSWRRIVVAP